MSYPEQIQHVIVDTIVDAADVAYEQDTALQVTDKGVFTLGVRNDSDADTTSGDGNYSRFSVDRTGRPKVLPYGQYRASPSTLSDGDITSPNISATGDVVTGIAGSGFTTAPIGAATTQNRSGGNVAMGTAPVYLVGTNFRAAQAPVLFKTRATAAIVAGVPAGIWTPAAASRVRLMIGQLSMSVAGQIILLDGAAVIIRSPQLSANEVWSFDLGAVGFISAAVNTILNIDVSVNADVGGWVGGIETP